MINYFKKMSAHSINGFIHAFNIKITLLVLASIFIVFYTACSGNSENAAYGKISVSGGRIDLSQVNFQDGETVKLDGMWEFHWNSLLAPEDFKKEGSAPGSFQSVPVFWTDYRGQSLPAKGYATYRLLIKTDGKTRMLGIMVPEIFTEYRLWINGMIIDEHGSFINRKVRFLKPDIHTFYNSTDVIEIVLQVKNYFHGNAGIGQSFVIGDSHYIIRNHTRSIMAEMILIAICVFAGIYHSILFIFRPKEKELLFFGMFCIAIALRTLATGNTLLMQIFPDLGFQTGSRFATFLIPLCAITFFFFSYYFFVTVMNKPLFRTLLTLNLLYVPLVFFASTFFYSTVFTWYLAVVAISSVFIIYTSVIASARGNRYGIIFLAGFLFLFTGVMNDILHYKQVINTGYYLCLWFTAFIIAQSVMLAVKFANEHRLVEELSVKLQSMDRLKDEFLANTSHELKTPLTGIIGIGESLIGGVAGRLPEAALSNLKLLVSSGRRLSSLINDILDFSKLKNNDIEIQERPVDLNQIVSVVLDVIKTTLPDKNVQLIKNIPEDLPCVSGDENRLYQILYNLAGNAVKFTGDGYVKVTAADMGDEIKVTVEDTGIGIAEDKIHSIFGSFQQADGSISREYGGTGLGLSITSRLVELHGGKLGVESEEGKGTKFFFSLRKCEGEKNGRDLVTIPGGYPVNIYNEVHIKYSPGEATGTNPRLLVVDDESINIQVIMNFLSLGNYHADFATNGEDAIKMIEQNGYSLVLLDIMMPKMSGYEVCRKVREKYSRFEMPVLFLTAKIRSEDMITAFESGANDYLTKPFDRNELIARVETHLALRNAVRLATESQALANIDPLTGLYNRRYFFNEGEKEFLNSLNNGKPVSVLMMDIDHFKQINDTFGHAVGDIVIKRISSIIIRNVRGGDIAGRYGGEEFIVILPGTDSSGAEFLAEKIRTIIENETIRSEDYGDIGFTISIGVASSNNMSVPFEDILHMADMMLYKAKQDGRNRVVSQ